MRNYDQFNSRFGTVRMHRDLRCPGCGKQLPARSGDLSDLDLIPFTCDCGERVIELEPTGVAIGEAAE